MLKASHSSPILFVNVNTRGKTMKMALSTDGLQFFLLTVLLDAAPGGCKGVPVVAVLEAVSMPTHCFLVTVSCATLFSCSL